MVGESDSAKVVGRTRMQLYIHRLRMMLASQLGGGTVVAFAVSVVGTGLSFCLQIFLARVMSLDSYGGYVYVITVSGLIIIFVKFGMDASIVRFISTYVEKRQWSNIRGLIRRSVQIVVMKGALAGFALLAITWMLASDIDERLSTGLTVAAFGLPIVALTSVLSGGLRGLMDIIGSRVPLAVIQPVLMFGLVAYFSFGLKMTIDTQLGVGLYFLAALAVLAVTWILLLRRMPFEVRHSSVTYDTNKWYKVSFHLFLISGLFVLMDYTDILMVGAFTDIGQAGIYSTVTRTAALTLFGLNAVNVIAAPMISVYSAKGDREALDRLAGRCTTALTIFSVPLAGILLVYGERVLSLFGSEFTSGYQALTILLGAQLVNAVMGPVGLLMTMTGYQRPALVVVAASLAMNIILNAALIPIYGIEGAAAATAISIVTWNVLLALLVFRYLKIRVIPFSNLRLGGIK